MTTYDDRITELYDVVISHAKGTGRFESVSAFEVSNAPRHGVVAEVIMDELRACTSGLASTSALFLFIVRIRLNYTTPEDRIDPTVLGAAWALMEAYNGDFTLGGNADVRSIDVFGHESGERLTARPGYMVQDSTKYRAMVIRLPIILNDCWAQAS